MSWPPKRIECEAHWPTECKAAFGEWYEKHIMPWIAETEVLYRQIEDLENKLHYFESAVCTPQMLYQNPHGGVQMAIDPRKVADVVRENDDLRKKMISIAMTHAPK